MAGSCWIGMPLGWAVFFAFAVHLGMSIMCWECNSKYDVRCADPFQKYSFDRADCSQRSLPHRQEVNSTICRKTVQRVGSEYRTIRGCGFLEEYNEKRICYRRAGTFDIMIDYCVCAHDDCNGATSVSVSGSAVFISIVVLVLLITFHRNV